MLLKIFNDKGEDNRIVKVDIYIIPLARLHCNFQPLQLTALPES